MVLSDGGASDGGLLTKHPQNSSEANHLSELSNSMHHLSGLSDMKHLSDWSQTAANRGPTALAWRRAHTATHRVEYGLPRAA